MEPCGVALVGFDPVRWRSPFCFKSSIRAPMSAEPINAAAPLSVDPPQPAAANQDDFRKIADFRLALFEFQRQSEAVLEEFKIGSRQFYAMLIIKNSPAGNNATIGKVAEGMSIHPSSASGLVARLESSGLAERIFDLENRRQVRVKLTARGEELLARILVTDAQFTAQLSDQYRELMAKIS